MGCLEGLFVFVMVQVKSKISTNIDNNEAHIFELLVKEAQNNTSFLLRSKKDVMHLPLYIALGVSVIEGYEEFYEKYIALLKSKNVNKDVIKDVEKLCNGLQRTVREYLRGNVPLSYSIFKKCISSVIRILPFISIKDGVFYRMRADSGLTDEKEFWHIPFDKAYLSKSERFSIGGYPILYLGCSKHVCEIEISCGTLAEFTCVKEIDKVLDLTLGQGEGKKLISEIDLVKIYPLIASCYAVPFYSTFIEKECKPKGVSFREEYIIPQLLTVLMRNKYKANGICYYSVKDPNLNPSGDKKNDFRNVALYTSRVSGRKHDKSLMNKFVIKIQ